MGADTARVGSAPAILTICTCSLLPLHVDLGPPLEMLVLVLSEPHAVSVPTEGCPPGGTRHLHHHSHMSCCRVWRPPEFFQARGVDHSYLGDMWVDIFLF